MVLDDYSENKVTGSMLITNLPSQWSQFYSPYLQLYIKILLWLCFTFLFLELMTYIHRRPWRWSESSWCHIDASELPCNTNKDLNTLHKRHLSCTDNQANVNYKGNTAIQLNFINRNKKLMIMQYVKFI